ncbi:MAG TPA: sterol desaturase family protein [Candidatus Binataceae bacterium]|nr:sterol desaturase family protein [Candidatus Binataceae bacterium]
MLIRAFLFATGIFAWTFAEYAIHGWLGHRYRTFATPLHAVHHQDPRAVFTVGAWIPVTVVTLAATAIFGNHPEVYALGGLVCGFVLYEIIHYRIHFARPVNSVEAQLRTRHLAHHLRAPDRIFGVTTALWDRTFGTEPSPAQRCRHEREVRGYPILTGPSNWRRAFTITVRWR